MLIFLKLKDIMGVLFLGGDILREDYSAHPGTCFRLNLQMVIDSMGQRNWEYLAHRPEEMPVLTKCLMYHGQRELSSEVLYVVPEGMERNFPADLFSYITTTSLQGEAPHIRSAGCSFPELMNHVMDVFSCYADLERELCNTISNGGSLSELCCVAARYFQNPVFVHDDMFCVIGQSDGLDGMFEFSEKTKKTHIPLWLINELKFDAVYKSTVGRRQAGIWGFDLNEENVRSLYVNLWEGEEYLGRLHINEANSALKPGQFRAAEFLAGYVVLWMKNQAMSNQQINYSYEQTFVDLLTKGETDERDLKTVLGILNWKREDRFLCLKLQSQDTVETIRSELAINSRLSSVLSGHVSFRHQQKLCVIINLSVSGMDLGELRLRLAPLIRDSCLYVGISNPVAGIYALRRGFVQADIALDYITGIDSSDWMVLFASCALHYIRDSACERLPANMVAHPVLLDLLEHDRTQGTQYYDTLRAYLLCERNIPATAAALIIHRTTLTYRLGKIMELTRLNLDNADLRLYLMLSFQLLEQGEA